MKCHMIFEHDDSRQDFKEMLYVTLLFDGEIHVII